MLFLLQYFVYKQKIYGIYFVFLAKLIVSNFRNKKSYSNLLINIRTKWKYK